MSEAGSELEEPVCVEVKWRRNIKRCRDEILACLNPKELLQYLEDHNLVSSHDVEILLMDTKTRQDKVHHILQILETTDKRDAYTIFIKCLDEEVRQKGGHMGHIYLLAILKGEQYASKEELQAFKASKDSVLRHRKGLLNSLNPSFIVPVMYKRNLLTADEQERLLFPNKTRRDKIEELLLMLETKGPSAYALFEECLGEERSHCSHIELHKMIISRKRKKDQESTDEVCSVPKRTPQRLRMEKPFCGEVYTEFIASIKKCYQRSSWEELESLAQSFIQQNEDPQLRALAEIEKGYSFSCRKGMRKKAFECLDEAQIIARQINGSNYYYLLARCKHIRATMLRYEGKDDESLTKNQAAYDLLCDCAPGDDASRVTYGIACARLEMLEKTRIPPLQEINEIRAYFDFCVSYSQEGTPGLCASKARCLIRLAQLSLGTTTDGKCWSIAAPDDIEKAEYYLKQVDVSVISHRCQALYYVIKSDLFNSMDEIVKAIQSTETALMIAKENQLGAELQYAESRLKRLVKYET